MQLPEQVSLKEYLRLDEASEVKLEYHAGHVYAMSGGALRHNRISFLIAAALTARTGCRVVVESQRVCVDNPIHDHAYPDVVLYCGEPAFADDKQRTLLNPTIVAEVLSDSTERNDRGWKMEAYTQIPSLREYWLIEQTEPAVTRFIRKGKNLPQIDTQRGPEGVLEGEGYSIPVRALYED